MGWLNTYYVYDDFENLRFVIQPRSVEIMLAAGNWNISNSLRDELNYYYSYDDRKRIIIKKVPGAGETWMVYDARDRVVMMQDSNLRVAAKWLVTKYDSENRPDSTGLLSDANSRSYHQNLSYNIIGYPSTNSNFELLTQSFFDTYSWATSVGLSSSFISTYTGSNSYFNTSYNTSPSYSQQILPYAICRGLQTGSKSKVLGTASQFLSQVTFYDDHGRIIETQKINQTGGIDTLINQYDFVGNRIRNLFLQKNAAQNAQNHSVLTKIYYDAGKRISSIYKNIDNGGSDQLIVTNMYNENGQLMTKNLGNVIDSLGYKYNIRGWLSTINQNFVVGTMSGNYFGMELAYDKITSVVSSTSYLNPVYTGNIAGVIWKTAGDGVNRKYDFQYDNINRLNNADFNQFNGSGFDKSGKIDFSVNNIFYDANGNILSMNQNGFKIGGSSTIDQLSYTYLNNSSNKLVQVNDAVNDPTTKLGDFHYSGIKQGSDYFYDGNGNLVIDNNKSINNISYNHLNLPTTLSVTTKGNISYTYDAAGNKLYKTVIDSTINPVRVTRTTFISGLVYQASSPISGGPVGLDTLQFILHEEGRVRWAFHRYLNGSSKYGFEYDFFEKDHLGNTRVVLTQEKDTSIYLASGEAAFRVTENQLFANIATTAIARTSAPPYPNDLSITNPNDTIFKVSGEVGSHKTGPSLLLKVMSGDKLDLSVQSFYNTGTTSSPNSSLTDILASLATGIVNSSLGGKGTISDLNNTTTSPIFAALNSFLVNDPNPTGKPKAYLNWILLDEQLNYVSSYPQSGAIVVGSPGTLNTLGYTGLPITKNGYLYVWVSNETPNWYVFFDNLKVAHYTGPELEETHYYPFGLTMAGISSKALKTNYTENGFKYNGKELQSKEFLDGSGISLYDFGKRLEDPQIGRWWVLDPKADLLEMSSPYAYCFNNPNNYTDPDGELAILINGKVDDESERHSSKYWQGIDAIIQNSGIPNTSHIKFVDGDQFRPHSFHFSNGDYDEWGGIREGNLEAGNSAMGRRMAGYSQGQKDFKGILDRLAKDPKTGKATEKIQIYTHSRGAAFGAGYAEALLENIRQNPERFANPKDVINLILNMAPNEASHDGTDAPKGIRVFSMHHDYDQFSGSSQKNTAGNFSSDERVPGPFGTHSIASFGLDLKEFLSVFSKEPEDHKDDIKLANDFLKRMQDAGVKVTEQP